MDMQHGSNTLGATGIPTDAITVGTSPLGRGTAPGSPEEAESIATAVAMLTGPFGSSTPRTSTPAGGRRRCSGAALAAARRRRDRRVSSRRSTATRDTGAFDRDRVLRSYDESLARLGVDRVEVLHLHDPYTVTFAEARGPGGAIEGLRELRDSGAVDAIGIAAGPIPLMREYVETGVFDVVLSHNRYTLVDRSAEPLFAEARRRGMGVFNAAPVRRRHPRHGRARRRELRVPARVGRTHRLGAARPKPSAPSTASRSSAAALHFSLRSPLVDTTVVGHLVRAASRRARGAARRRSCRRSCGTRSMRSGPRRAPRR